MSINEAMRQERILTHVNILEEKLRQRDALLVDCFELIGGIPLGHQGGCRFWRDLVRLPWQGEAGCDCGFRDKVVALRARYEELKR